MPAIGRIETYTYSDRQTQHRGAAMVRVTCVTDFAATAPAFRDFAELCAKRAYIHKVTDFKQLCQRDPEVQAQWDSTEEALREKIAVTIIAVEDL